MRALVAISLIAFTSIAVFGFIGLTHGSIFSACAMAVMAPETNCPAEPTAQTSILHAQIFQNFSEGIMAALIFLTAAVLISFGLVGDTFSFQSQTYIVRNFQIPASNGHIKTKFTNWLKTLIKQDALSA